VSPVRFGRSCGAQVFLLRRTNRGLHSDLSNKILISPCNNRQIAQTEILLLHVVVGVANLPALCLLYCQWQPSPTQRLIDVVGVPGGGAACGHFASALVS